MYKQDMEAAIQAERETKKENLRLTFQIDELTERHKYMEKKYLQLVQRVGASQEDLEAVEVLMASGEAGVKQPRQMQNGAGGKGRMPQKSDHHGYLYGENDEP